MKALSLLLFLFSVLSLSVTSESQCSLEDVIHQKIKEDMKSLILELFRGIDLHCKTITARGDLASCPAGHAVTGCTCGMGCGSWDVRGANTCHCQCAGMDWTGARCCQLRHTP
ncbi:resistin [Thomomys bottae]